MSDTAITAEKPNGHPPPGHFEEPPRPQKKQLTPEEMKAETKRLRIVNRYQRTKLESEVLLEAWNGWDPQGFGGTDTTDAYLRMRSQAVGFGAPLANPNDRRAGRKWSWQNDTERLRALQASRMLCASNDFAKAMLRNQVNYTIGKGFSYKAGIKGAKPFIAEDGADEQATSAARKEYLTKKRGAQKIVDAVQKWLDEFCARNNWNAAASAEDVGEDGSVNSASSTREREAHWRVDRDGEALIRLFFRDDGRTDVRFVGPEVIWGTPAGKTEEDGWSFGMQHLVIIGEDDDGNETRHVDLERIKAYFIRPHAMGQEPKGVGKDPSGEVVPAAEIVHIKDPWEDAEVKHGTPGFAYDTYDAIVRATNLQRNISITSSVQAATAEIWKHTTGTKEQIQNLQSGPLARTVTDAGGATFVEQRVKAGMIRRVPAGQEPVPDPATTQVPNYMQAVQGDLRQAGAGASMPEFLVSGDASNGNYASINEAGVPYVRSSEARQEHFKTAFLRLMWRVIRHAVKLGKLPEEALTVVEIHVEGMEIVKNNEGELAQARTANLAAKVTSPQIEIAKLGNDIDQVKADWKEWDEEMAPQGQPGMPSAPGAAPGETPPAAGQADQQGASDPLAGVPQMDLSGEDVSAAAKVPDAKRSMAAKQGWIKRGVTGPNAQEAQESRRQDATKWVQVPADILEAINAV